MADVNTYRRCLVPYATPGWVFTVGELRPASDPAVIANPQYWAVLSDSDFTASSTVTWLE